MIGKQPGNTTHDLGSLNSTKQLSSRLPCCVSLPQGALFQHTSAWSITWGMSSAGGRQHPEHLTACFPSLQAPFSSSLSHAQHLVLTKSFCRHASSQLTLNYAQQVRSNISLARYNVPSTKGAMCQLQAGTVEEESMEKADTVDEEPREGLLQVHAIKRHCAQQHSSTSQLTHEEEQEKKFTHAHTSFGMHPICALRRTFRLWEDIAQP
eukprot:1142421-Pelagomonas_calceolata.AAC.3